MSLTSWGGLPPGGQREVALAWQDELPAKFPASSLVVGCGRSYGDVGIAAGDCAVLATGLNRILAFDIERGILRCEGGTTLGDILDLVLNAGWIIPVMPGTRHVSIGGAVANDVHGKNHHSAGTFGCHLRALLLQRSDGERLLCSATENPQWFQATVAGLGLTGAILEVELQLVPVKGGWLNTETIKFNQLDEFFSLSRESDEGFDYTVAWIDCLSKSSRGHFSRANHSLRTDVTPSPGVLFDVPFTPPVSPVNRFSLRAFNSLYFHRQRQPVVSQEEAIHPWFFPLDRIGHWNRLYGRKGFRQYQCVVEPEAVAELLSVIREAREGSMLAVLKMFGDRKSPGLLSFPRPGASLALDFPWRGTATTDLFKRLDAVVASSGGAVYPAKDAHMSAADFRRAYPAWETLEKFRDPRLKSRFWQRVTEN
jgi:FAD/FMN-containing dehydrogenase